MFPFTWLKNIEVYLIIRYILEWVTQIRQRMGMQIIYVWKIYGEYIFREKMNKAASSQGT